MVEGGGWLWFFCCWSYWECNDREVKDGDDLDCDLLRVVLSDLEDFVFEDVKSILFVVCSCVLDF